MPTAEHRCTVRADFATAWAFARDMDNWAPFITGYQRHEKLSQKQSIWFLKGELGGLTRIAEFKVNIDEWDESGHVRFSLEGINEPVTGSGSFDAHTLGADGGPAISYAVALAPPSLWRRWLGALSRAILGKVFGSARQTAEHQPSQGEARTEIVFVLTLTASGVAGMVLNALLTPMMKPVAEDLAAKMAEAIEARAA